MKRTVLLFAVIVLVGCSPSAPSSATETQTSTQQSATSNLFAGEAAVRAVVEAFGKQLQTVSLLSDSAPMQIMAQYGHYIAPELLILWATDPSHAPGRQTSSPWPDRIEITSVEQQDASTFLVTGEVIEITSAEQVNGGVAAQYPVHLTVKRIGESWLITAFESGDYE